MAATIAGARPAVLPPLMATSNTDGRSARHLVIDPSGDRQQIFLSALPSQTTLQPKAPIVVVPARGHGQGHRRERAYRRSLHREHWKCRKRLRPEKVRSRESGGSRENCDVGPAPDDTVEGAMNHGQRTSSQREYTRSLDPTAG